MKKLGILAVLLATLLTACVPIRPVANAPADGAGRTARLTGAAPAAAAKPEIVDVSGAPVATIEEASADSSRYYRLQTMFLEGENKCLEGNRLAEESVLGGAAFQDDCQDVTGQLWKIVPAADGYYRLQTMFLEEENKCLEGNRLAEDSVLGGGAFQDDCQDVSGQLWQFVDAGDGYYRLQTMFLEEENKCLEGNQLAEDSVLGGAAFMDDCQDVTGQLWKIVSTEEAATGRTARLTGAAPAAGAKREIVDVSGAPVVTIEAASADSSRYYRLQSMASQETNKCLEGNRLANESVLKGAAFQDDCQNATGQFWKIVPAADGYYRLQTKFLEAQKKCLEGQGGAAPGSGDVLDGAAFMDTCQDVTGQFWKFVDAGNGYYHLQTELSEGLGKCLEGQGGAAPGSGDVLDGAAFMDTCQAVTGQLWQIIRAN